MAAGYAILARPGWTSPLELRGAGIACGWDVAGPSPFSMTTTRAHLKAVGLRDPKGWWLRYDHPTQGRWAGVIEDVQSRADGSVAIGAISLHKLLAGKRTARNYTTGHAPAGVIAQRALRDAATETTVWIDSVAADEDGALLSQDWRGADLVDVLDGLANSSGQEWDVTLEDDWSISWEWRVRLGLDRTGTVLLREGCELADVEVTESIATIVNDRLAVSDADEWPDAASAVAEDPDSIAAYGRQQDTAAYLGADAASLEAYALTDLATLAQPVRAMTATMAATHPLANEVRHGDIVRVWLKTGDFSGTCRITTRAVDVDLGTIALAGELDVDVT